jgi:thioredoxin 1
MVKIYDGNLKDVVSEGIWVVDFFADWCGPCKMLSPVLEEIEQTTKDVNILKINVDDYRQIAIDYNVRSIPNVHLFNNGVDKGFFAGFIPKEKVLEFIEQNK